MTALATGCYRGYALLLRRGTRHHRGTHIRRIGNALLGAPGRPRHLQLATAIEAGITNQANTGQLVALKTRLGVSELPGGEHLATRALLSRMDVATGASEVTAGTMLTRTRRLQFRRIQLGNIPIKDVRHFDFCSYLTWQRRVQFLFSGKLLNILISSAHCL